MSRVENPPGRDKPGPGANAHNSTAAADAPVGKTPQGTAFAMLAAGNGRASDQRSNDKAGHGSAWARHATALAAWTDKHLVNRRDAWGGYYRGRDGKTKQVTRKAEDPAGVNGKQGTRGPLTLADLVRHFGATTTDAVIGLHAVCRDKATGEGETASCWSRWGAVDIDQHEDKGDPDANLRFALELYDRASKLGFVPLLYDSNGKGGYHLVLVFNDPVPTAKVYALMKWLTRDHADFGFESVETFPKQAKVTDAHPFGNWLRLPGRHHTREHYTRVWNGLQWLDGSKAITAIVSTTGTCSDAIPAEAIAEPGPRKLTPSESTFTFVVPYGDEYLARDALRVLGPSFYDDYELWLKVGFSLRKLGQAGLHLWDDWSRQSRKYQEGVCRLKWETMTDEGINFGSLMTWAKEAGWINPNTTLFPGPKATAGGKGNGPPPPGPATGGPEPPPDEALAKRPRTDLGNAERLVARHGRDLRYCHPWTRWLIWDGRRWKLDDTGEPRRRAKNTVRAIFNEAKTIEDEEKRKAHALWAITSEKRDKIGAMLHLAEVETGVPILHTDMDGDPWAFNCHNGTLDLRSGGLRPHRREDLITKLCNLDYDPAAACPLWLSTLETFFRRNDPARQAELIDYWQRLCGYCLAGVIRDHVMPVAYGTGSNGKSTILGTMLGVFGPDYAMKCPPDMLMAKKTDSHPTDRADLFGKRLIIAIETEMGRRINETMIKELTGGDSIRARRMRENFWEFNPTHTLIMATNHKPAIRGTDHGIWRRMKLVPFTVTLNDGRADKAMPEKLRAEFRGILAWCVRGCMEWQKRGLESPDEVTEATAKYRREQDLIGAFLAECAITGPGLRIKAGALYHRYAAWAAAGNEHVATLSMFGLAMEERGIEKKTSNGIWYLGLALREEASDDKDSVPY